MKTVVLLLALWPAVVIAADQNAVAPSPKLTALLDAKDDKGQPILTAQQHAYFDGMNDHLRELLNRAVEKETITRAEHLGILLDLELRPQKMELLLENNCALCHSDSQNHSADTLFAINPAPGPVTSHMNLKEVVEDVHFQRGVSCAGCHGGDPAADLGHAHVKEWPEKDRQKNRAWVVQFCARCHSNPAMMHDFNPALPTDQLAKFKESPHGHRLLDLHDDRAPSCVNCHGVHGIRAAKDPLSKVFAQRVPETCGACHANAETMKGITRADGSPMPTTQLAEFRESVHGHALLKKGDLGAPACNDCHGNHAAIPPGVASVSRSCSLCHSTNASLFDGSKHKQAFDQHRWPECSKCHGNHTIAKTNDDMLKIGSGALCTDCHRQFANNPDCEATADYFHHTIAKMDESRSNLIAVSEKLAAKGLDIDPINAQITELTDVLKKSRTYVHSFTRNSFQQVALPGEQAARNGDDLVVKAREEYKYRQVGLAVSIAVIGVLMLLVYLKLRQLEK